jgi:hypothetical protein
MKNTEALKNLNLTDFKRILIEIENEKQFYKMC